MAARIRNTDWKDDMDCCAKMKELVSCTYTRQEVVDEMKRLFPQYAWSVPTLANRLKHFGIRYIQLDATLDQVKAAVQEELKVFVPHTFSQL